MANKTDTNSTTGFVGSIFKFSISTVINIAIFGTALLLSSVMSSLGVFTQGEYGQAGNFVSWTNTIMTIVILGLDQTFIRFYHNPPGNLSKNGLFRICFYFSSAAMVIVGAVCSTLLQMPIYKALNFEIVGPGIIPLLFLNAFFYMVLRYFNVLYRMEMNIRVYTVESIFMQFFYKLFYLAGAFAYPANPLAGMIGASIIGLGGFAMVFSFIRRKTLRPRPQEFRAGAYRTLLPYAAATAPTAVLVTLNASVAGSFIIARLGSDAAGIYVYANSLSNAVTLIQGGFASFWGAYMFENYKTQQKRILQVHDYLNFVILCFFAVLVAFEDIIFWVLRGFAEVQAIFPIMMLSAVFTILGETTVYGNAIARKPIFDTIGIGLGFVTNVILLQALTGSFQLYGAAIALAVANFVAFLFRTITAQRLYRSIESPARTIVSVAIAIALAIAGTLLNYYFIPKLLCCLAGLALYCVLYRKQLRGLWQIATSILNSLFKRT